MMFKYIFNEDLGSDPDFKGKTWMSNRQRYDRLPAEIEIWDHTSYIFSSGNISHGEVGIL